MAFFRTKKFYWTVGIVAVVGIFIGFQQYKKSQAPAPYDTTPVVRGNLVQTVSATGKLEAIDDLSLRFETSGTVGSVQVHEGDTVKAGTTIATLKIADLEAQVAKAMADLNQKLAGPTDQDRAYYTAAVASAKASLEQSRIDGQTAISAAQADVDTAKNNLQLAEGGEDSQLVGKAYDDGVVTLQSTLTKLDDALVQMDNVLGIDNPTVNDSFESYLGNRNAQALPSAIAAYIAARTARNDAKSVIASLTTVSTRSDVDAAFPIAEVALSKTNQALIAVNDLLVATSYSNTTLQTNTAAVVSARTAITTQYTTTISQRQAIANAKNSFSTYSIAYNKAVQALAQTQANATNQLAAKQALYDQAVANLDTKVKPPREVDIAAYRAALAQAVANRDKGVIRAPIDGVVTKINKKPGEFIASSEVMANLLSPRYEVQVDIPETEVAKVTERKQNQAVLTFDAFGDEKKFSGEIISIDKNSTDIQDVVYYRVKIALTGEYGDTPVKPGMTVNVDIVTNTREDVLSVPSRTVRTVNDQKMVQVLEGKEVTDVPIRVGMRADDGKIEVLSGLNEGQLVVLGKK